MRLKEVLMGIDFYFTSYKRAITFCQLWGLKGRAYMYFNNFPGSLTFSTNQLVSFHNQPESALPPGEFLINYHN